jgi:hypothetical protein
VRQICGVCKYATQRRKSLDIFAECRIPRHATPFRSMPRDAAFVPQLLWQILH